jgi:hypothetical protein
LCFGSGRLVVMADAVNTFFDFLPDWQQNIVTIWLLLIIQPTATVDSDFSAVRASRGTTRM